MCPDELIFPKDVYITNSENDFFNVSYPDPRNRPS